MVPRSTGITWYEAATFVNWLNTSSGGTAAYKFSGTTFQLWDAGDTLDYDSSNPYRSRRAKYCLPSVDEWYKAAYYDPVSDTYSDYATGGDVPTGHPASTAGGTSRSYSARYPSTPTGRRTSACRPTPPSPSSRSTRKARPCNTCGVGSWPARARWSHAWGATSRRPLCRRHRGRTH